MKIVLPPMKGRPLLPTNERETTFTEQSLFTGVEKSSHTGLPTNETICTPGVGYGPNPFLHEQVLFFNPIALRKAKIAYNFGLSECNRVKDISVRWEAYICRS